MSTTRSLCSLSFSAFLLLGACAPVASSGLARDGGAKDPWGTDDGGDEPVIPKVVLDASAPNALSSCGAQTFAVALDAVPPNIYLVVDRSGSMSDEFGPTLFGSKWVAAQAALQGLLTSRSGKARWGMSLFPPNPQQDACGKAVVDVPLAMGSEAAVLSRVNGLSTYTIGHPRGMTPTADALETARDAGGLTATDRNNYVVLVTDGLPNCNSSKDVGKIIDQLYQRTPSVKTFVIGVGSETQSNPATLNDWADRGHTARNGPGTRYYQANDATQLGTAFVDVVDGAAACVFALQSLPQDPALVVGQLDGVAAASDPLDGYTYDAAANAISFHGASCAQITSGATKKVQVIYGCPPTKVL